MNRMTATGCCALALFSVSDAVMAQTFPSRPIRIVTAEAGGASDFSSRFIAQQIAPALGQQVIVDNRGAAGGAIAAEIVARANPDGHTLLHYGSNIWMLPFLRDKVPYDVLKDFAPVILTVRAPAAVVVHPTLPVKSIGELLAMARAKPGELGYASGGTGSTPHLAAELFKAMGGVNITRIPYKGGGPALNDLLGGQVKLMFPVISPVRQHLQAGRLRGLAVTSAQPSELVPELPTVAASGLPGYESVSLQGLFAPAKTPAAVIARLNQEINRALATPELKQRFLASGVETVGGAPAVLGDTVKSEMARLGKVIRDAGIRDE